MVQAYQNGGVPAAYLIFPSPSIMNENTNPSPEQVASQFAVVELVPRTEIWSKDPERSSPTCFTNEACSD